MSRLPTAAEARRHLAAIAREPRPAGGDAERAARAHCAASLRDLGFAVHEEPFEFSALPGRLATPLAGLLSIGALAAAGHAGHRGDGVLALAALLGVGVPLVLGAAWMARRGVLALPWMRRRSLNLVATRGSDAPRAWLVAHLDSKSQPVPIGVRALGIVLTAVAWVAALGTAALQLAGHDVARAWPLLSALGALAGLPVAASVVRARSPGALDDASGVATVLLAAAALPAERPVGVLLTSAEELGLAGARAWATKAPPAVAVNVDGVDDAGATRIMFTGRRPTGVVEALLRAAAAAGVRARAARLLPGILADGVALADAGWEAVTVSRGTVRTVARIHTPGDVIEAIRGDGIAATAAVIAAALPELT